MRAFPLANDEVAVHKDKKQLNDSNTPETPQHTNDGDETAKMEEILRKWEIVKKTNITERPPIPNIKHTRQAKEVLEIVNKAINLIKAKKGQTLSLTEVNELFYSSASVVCDTVGVTVRPKTQKKPKVPLWKRQIQKDIRKIRVEVSILTEILQGRRVKEKKRRALMRNPTTTFCLSRKN